MTQPISTKEQELEVLAKIRNLVDELGPDSYVGTAFRGCFEDAQYNIENDFACSPYSRWMTEKKKADGLEEQVADLKNRITNVINQNTNLIATYQAESEEKTIEIDTLRTKCKTLQEQVTSLKEERETLSNLLSDSVLRTSKAEADIIHLKARLYDYLVNE